MSQPIVYVALLRGINVGGNNKVPMSDLKACFEKLGFQAVTTYINSGNVIFAYDQMDPRELEQTIEKALHENFTLPIKVVVKSLKEMNAIMKHVPKGWPNPDQRCNVIFLRHNIDTKDLMNEFTPKLDIESLSYCPGALFWAANTSDLTRSNMIKVANSPLYKDMTIRIYNSALKIHNLMQTINRQTS